MPLTEGTRLGPYLIQAPLGAGGMGEVYRATDTRLDREVAVKVLPEQTASDPITLARFEREAKAVAALSHPNILAIHDVGNEDKTAYVVMELLEGETLRETINRTALNWRKAVELAIGIADGLAAAHGRGIIHRDLKPENAFITADGLVKILDFGLAKAAPVQAGRESVDSPTLTMSTTPGAIIGTAAYMSPEQVEGRPADARSDIFSFGCILYEMLHNRRAFMKPTTAETMTAILREEPTNPDLSTSSLHPELERIIARCLEKKPEHRFQSAQDLAFTLRSALSSSGITAPKKPRPRPLAAVTFAVVVLALVALSAMLWWKNPSGDDRGPRINSLAVLPFANASGDPSTEYLSDELPASIINSLSRLDGLRVVPRSTVFRYKDSERNTVAIARELEVGAVLTGYVDARGDRLTIQTELIDVNGNRQLWGEKYSRTTADLITIEQDIARRISEALRLRLSGKDQAALKKHYTENPEARRAYLEAVFWSNKRSEDGLDRAIRMLDHAIATDPNYALAYVARADAYMLLTVYYRRPKDLLPEVKSSIEKALELDETLAEAYATLGLYRFAAEFDNAGAAQAFDRGLELNPRYARLHHWYGFLHTARRRHEEALECSERARELDPGSLIINADSAIPLFLAGRTQDAFAQIETTLQMDPGFVPARRIQAMMLLMDGRVELGIEKLKLLHASVGRIAATAGMLGAAQARLGNVREARAELQTLHELAKRQYVPAIAFAKIHANLGETDEALDWLQKAIDDRDQLIDVHNRGPGLEPLWTHARYRQTIEGLGLNVPEPRENRRPAIRRQSLAVLPFEHRSADEDAVYLADEIPASIIDSLGSIAEVAVIPRSSAFRHRDDTEDPVDIAHKLNADLVLTGQINARKNDLRIRAELVDVHDNRILWSQRYHQSVTDVYEIERNIVSEIARALRLQLGVDVQLEPEQVSPERAEAYPLYLQGRFLWRQRNESSFTRAVDRFRKAIEIDRAFARAYCGLADTLVVHGFYGYESPQSLKQEIQTSVSRAIDLQPERAEPHVSRAAYLAVYELDWPGARRSFEKAVALRPDYAVAHHWKGILLHLPLGEMDEALKAVTEAARLEPDYVTALRDIGLILYCSRKYSDAIRQFESIIELEPEFASAWWMLALARLQIGDHDGFIDAFTRFFKLEEPATAFTSALGRAYDIGGIENVWTAYLEHLLDREAADDYVSSSAQARCHMMLGRPESAAEQVEKAFEQRDGWIIWANVDPFWDPLRRHPKFQSTIRRMGLKPIPAPNPPALARTRNKTMLAVLPFKNLGNDHEQEYFSDGMTEEMITTLGRLNPDRLGVIARTSSMKYKNTAKAIREIARELNVDYVVEGTIRRGGDRVRIAATLIDADDQTQLWSNSFDRNFADVFKIQDEVATSIADSLALQLIPNQVAGKPLPRTSVSAAHNEYLLGRYYWARRTPEDLHTAIRHFDNAVRLDPDYALAYTGLADAWGVMHWYAAGPYEKMRANSKAAAEKALALNDTLLNDTLAEAHVSMGLVAGEQLWDFKTANMHFERAIEIDPNNATAHQWYGLQLSIQGRFDEAEVHFKTAITLDPLSSVMFVDYGWGLNLAHRFDEAIEKLNRAIELSPSASNPYGMLTRSNVSLRNYDKAGEAFVRFLESLPRPAEEIATFREDSSRSGFKTALNNWLGHIEKSPYVTAITTSERAMYYACCENFEKAIEWLRRAVEENDPLLPTMPYDFLYDPMRNDPRFIELQDKVLARIRK